VFERSEALVSLLAKLDQAVDPYRSAQVARALRRAVVRDLDRRVAGALLLAEQGAHDASAGRFGRRATLSRGRLVVLADTLEVLRPDGRSRCLAGRARSAAQRARSD
jgi:hypothetical protein